MKHYSQIAWLGTSGVRRKNFGRGFKSTAGFVGGPGALPPERRRIFENFIKNFLRKLKNGTILAYFSKTFKTKRLIFAPLGETNLVGKFSKFLMKIL